MRGGVVPGPAKIACYNPRSPEMRPAMRTFRLFLCALLLSTVAQAGVWTDGASAFAQKIAAKTGAATVTLDFKNASGLSPRDIDDVRRELIAQLAARGVRVATSGQVADVHVTLSENVSGLLWIAQVQQGSGQPSVVMVTVERRTLSDNLSTPAVILARKLLWIQDARILDAVLADSDGHHLLVLDPEKVSLYQSQNGQWQPLQSYPIPHSRPWPRDLRGRLMLGHDHLFDVYLPGVICASAGSTGAGSLTCRDADDAWPLDAAHKAFFSATRNFFTGAIVPAVGPSHPFFSAAVLHRDNYDLWLKAGTDRQLRLSDGVNEQIVAGAWGSDVAAVKSPCGSGWQLLATGNTDSDSPDSLRAFEIPDRELVAVSAPLDLPGPITALWTAPSVDAALVVTHNMKMDKDEAFLVSVSCAR